MNQRRNQRVSPAGLTLAVGVAFGASLLAGGTATAQTPPVTPSQRATAEQAAQAGVPLSELAPDAPDRYTVKAGDTLWGISGLFLKSPWRWPELWGMNLQDIRNPHRIYPGQQLVLDKRNGRATLRMGGGADGGDIPTVRVTPRTRISSLADNSVPTLAPHLIEPFLAEPLVVDEKVLAEAPRIVATFENRVLLSRGDRAYARGGLKGAEGGKTDYRVFRNARALKDPVSGEVLGYEAHYIGNARLVRDETVRELKDKDGKPVTEVVPATIDIVSNKEEMRVGDRLLPAPQRELLSYVPRAPQQRVEGRVVSLFGAAVAFAGQNQIVTINRGTKDGMERGHVLALLRDGAVLVDKTDDKRTQVKLPDERNGLMMVFLTFDRVSYALLLENGEPVRVGDRVVNPR